MEHAIYCIWIDPPALALEETIVWLDAVRRMHFVDHLAIARNLELSSRNSISGAMEKGMKFKPTERKAISVRVRFMGD